MALLHVVLSTSVTETISDLLAAPLKDWPPLPHVLACLDAWILMDFLSSFLSVLNRTPVHLVHEIILVDDFSDDRK